MKLDPVKFKERLVVMRRDREMDRDRLMSMLAKSDRPSSLNDALDMSAAITGIALLNQLYDAVEESMETEVRNDTSPPRIG